jgi:hypothetical protein
LSFGQKLPLLPLQGYEQRLNGSYREAKVAFACSNSQEHARTFVLTPTFNLIDRSQGLPSNELSFNLRRIKLFDSKRRNLIILFLYYKRQRIFFIPSSSLAGCYFIAQRDSPPKRKNFFCSKVIRKGVVYIKIKYFICFLVPQSLALYGYKGLFLFFFCFLRSPSVAFASLAFERLRAKVAILEKRFATHASVRFYALPLLPLRLPLLPLRLPFCLCVSCL